MFNFFKKKLKVGDRVTTTFKYERFSGTITAITVDPEVKWYGITLDDGHYVSRPEEDVERAKEDDNVS